MAEAEATSPRPQFLEVKCKSSGKTRRFASGTEAGFAISVINRKLGLKPPLALHIEALKEDEEPIAFGPNSLLVDYGHGWSLETVTDLEFSGVEDVGDVVRDPTVTKLPPCENEPHESPSVNDNRKATISFLYIGKIMFAFMLLFMLGAIFTVALENLPLLISQYPYK